MPLKAGMVYAVAVSKNGKDCTMNRIYGNSGRVTMIVLMILLSISAFTAASAETGIFSGIIVEVDEHDGVIIIEEDGRAHEYRFFVSEVRTSEGETLLGDDVEITDRGIRVNGVLYSLENLRVDEVYEGDRGLIGVVFSYHKQSAAAQRRRISRNRIGIAERLIIEYDDFVRGDVICFGGNIEINGEVNRNVVALFGDVIIKQDGIVRANVVAIDGRVYLKGDATVYGDIMSHRGLTKGARSRVVMRADGWRPQAFEPIIDYNRVDGLSVFAKYTFADADSILPSVHFGGGYAFEAERWRYDVGAHQRFFDKWSFAFGGSLFRQTSSDDHWISPKCEPTALAILAAEDPLDYYEEEGGRAYFVFNPCYYNEFGVSYRFTKLRWMDHHPKLWTVFGWDKEFRSNFSSVPAETRVERRDEFDSKLGQLSLWYTLDTRYDDEDAHRGWWANLEYQTAGDRLRGDHPFDRFTAEVRRYQPITYRQNINARIKYGTSGRDLPLFREFYLGGMRTVRGLDHKSLRGEQMILGNLEYVLYFPRHSFETALLFDMGKVVGRNDDIFSDGDFHSSIGVRFGLESGISIELAKSLDESDTSLKLWVLFQKSI